MRAELGAWRRTLQSAMAMNGRCQSTLQSLNGGSEKGRECSVPVSRLGWGGNGTGGMRSDEGELSDSSWGWLRFQGPSARAACGDAFLFEIAKGESEALVVDAEDFSQGNACQGLVGVCQGEPDGFGEGNVAEDLAFMLRYFEVGFRAVIV